MDKTDVLRFLIAATEKKTLRWSPTANSTVYRAMLDTGAVHVEEITHGYSLALLDKDGGTIEKYNSDDGGGLYEIMKTLYRLARTQANSAKIYALCAELAARAGGA